MAHSLAMEPRDSLFRRMLAISVALHVLALLVSALWMALRVPSVLVTPVTVVDLVGGGQLAPPAPKAAPEAKAPPSPGRSRGKTVAEKPRPSPRSAVKEKQTAPPKARAREVPPSEAREFSEKIRKMREERTTSTQVREAVESIQREKAIRAAVRGIGERVAHRVDLSGVPQQAKGTARSPAPAGMPGATGTARVSPEILAYARALDEKVRANWTVPDLAQKEMGKLIVQVRITIEKDGRVSNVRMEKVSANPYFDDSVRRAIQKASPLPIPPL
ncbi:MAG TPA: TonB family protein, partial [Candidatus Limnocylindrales bacterium]|nr:TonB family protein [Candidatus Limnocylindrales bacterium]